MELLKIFKKNKEKDMKLKELLKEKFLSFKNLLSNNNHVLSIMADLEEKTTGEYIFDMPYIKSNVNGILKGVSETIKYLNALSDGKYLELNKILEKIQSQIEQKLLTKIDIPLKEFTVSLDRLVNFENKTNIAGGKIAHLAELKAIGIPVPEGFVITSYAFLKFMEHNNLIEKINKLIAEVNIYDLENLTNCSFAVKELILNSEIPEEIANSIRISCKEIYEKLGKNCNFSVRSSAILEDTFLSFAGQYSSFLNVPEELIPEKYKEVVASLFNRRAIFYYKTKGFSESEMVMAVGILSMIDSKAGGVIYSKDPNNPESSNIIISAVKGLGKLVVDGSVTPETFIVKSEPKLKILKKFPGKQEKMLVCDREKDIKEIPLNKLEDQFSITDEEILALAELALKIENYYDEAQDIEWAIDKKGNIYILQARPLKILEKEKEIILPTRIKNYKILIESGVPGYKGIAYGKAFVLKDDSQLKDFPDGWILVAPHSDPRYVLIMNKASAIITDVGSPTSHMSCVAKEYEIPTILDTKIATKAIPHGKEITVDAFNCVVYEGKVEELLEKAQKLKRSKKSIKNLTIYKKLEEILKFIIPLNLTDPSSPDFKLENCKTLHDILRFAHEMAMREMFTIWEKYDSEFLAIPLQADIPISILILDLGGGLKNGEIKRATLEDIVSIPFRAILEGMKNVKWPEPRPVDASGFLGMVVHTASIPENELMEMGKKSFCIIAKEYMNFSIRLGYHFSLVESYVSENVDDNYIKFFFKGGGAALDRRLRRVWMISEILKILNFSVEVKNDVIDALLMGYDTESIKKRLKILGKLTGYTKQLDMALFHDTVAEMYLKDFIKLHIQNEL